MCLFPNPFVKLYATNSSVGLARNGTKHEIVRHTFDEMCPKNKTKQKAIDYSSKFWPLSKMTCPFLIYKSPCSMRDDLPSSIFVVSTDNG